MRGHMCGVARQAVFGRRGCRCERMCERMCAGRAAHQVIWNHKEGTAAGVNGCVKGMSESGGDACGKCKMWWVAFSQRRWNCGYEWFVWGLL